MIFKPKQTPVLAYKYELGDEAALKKELNLQDIVQCSDGKNRWAAVIINDRMVNVHPGQYLVRMGNHFDTIASKTFEKLFVKEDGNEISSEDKRS